MVLNLVVAIPYLVQPYSYKIEIARQIVSDIDFLVVFRPTFLPNHVIYNARVLHFLLYIGLSAQYFWRSESNQLSLPCNLRNRFSVQWIAVLLLFPLVLIIAFFFLMRDTEKLGTNTHFTSTRWFLLFVIGLGGLVMTPFSFHRCFMGIW